MPLFPGRAESHGFEYERNGTPRLFAASSSRIGEVIGKTAARPIGGQFVAFLEAVKASLPAGREIHAIRDHVGSRTTERVRAFLQVDPGVRMRYTPTCSSRLNQIEKRFSRIQRSVTTRGAFTSVKGQDKKIMRCIRQHNEDARPIGGKYDDPERRYRAILPVQ